MSIITTEKEFLRYSTRERILKSPDGMFVQVRCDEQGIIDEGKLVPGILELYHKYLNEKDKWIDRGMAITIHTTTIPSVLQCDCGTDIILEEYENTCKCGKIYSTFGTLTVENEKVE